MNYKVKGIKASSQPKIKWADVAEQTKEVAIIPRFGMMLFLQCFDTVGWATERASACLNAVIVW